MDKVYRIANPQQPSTSAAAAEKDTDWDKCVICQQVSGEVIKCPAGSKRSTEGAGYKSLADNLFDFKKINCLPSSMFSWLKEGQDIKETLRSHKAKWHDSCRLLYNKTKLERAAKRKAPPAKILMLPKSTLVGVQSKILIRQNSASSVGNLQMFQSYCIMLQHLVLMPMCPTVTGPKSACKTEYR